MIAALSLHGPFDQESPRRDSSAVATPWDRRKFARDKTDVAFVSGVKDGEKIRPMQVTTFGCARGQDIAPRT